jgi:hypothetical protein
MRATLPVVALTALALALTTAPPAPAATTRDGFTVEILVDGQPVPEYLARDTRYIEALEGREYAIRLRNPLGVRVAVALSVDGLNTIDAARSTALQARKWVLDPYATVTISGWQTSSSEARRFVFTTEGKSYGQWLGATANLGLISAVFFRERVPVPVTPYETGQADVPSAAEQSRAPAAPMPPAAAEAQNEAKAQGARKRDEYAATGIGRGMEHRVERVWLDLEPRPVASIDFRYEFRTQLVRLGVIPPQPRPDTLARRERARGFDKFCPVPER